MTTMRKNTFNSPLDFLKHFFRLFKGPSFFSTFYNTDRKFAEQVFLTVAMKNDCRG